MSSDSRREIAGLKLALAKHELEPDKRARAIEKLAAYEAQSGQSLHDTVVMSAEEKTRNRTPRAFRRPTPAKQGH